MEKLRIYQIECPGDKWREPLQELRYQFDQFKTSPFVSRLMSLLGQIEERIEDMGPEVRDLEGRLEEAEKLNEEFEDEIDILKNRILRLEDDLAILRERQRKSYS